MKQTITKKQQKAIADFLKGRHISAGLWVEDEPCSVAAINLALTGELTDNIPDCMSEVIGRWIIAIQDVMPDDMRNSDKWRELLPLAAGTGRGHERERLDIIMDWMWGTVLTPLQPLADKQGFGDKWRAMCSKRTPRDAEAAAYAARSAVWATDAAARDSAKSARDAAMDSARAAVLAAKSAARAANAVARDDSAWNADAAARDAARAAAWAAKATWEAWKNFNPPGLLEKLVKVDTQ